MLRCHHRVQKIAASAATKATTMTVLELKATNAQALRLPPMHPAPLLRSEKFGRHHSQLLPREMSPAVGSISARAALEDLTWRVGRQAQRSSGLLQCNEPANVSCV